MKDTFPNRVRLGIFEVDLRAGELREGERTVRLHEQPFQVLRMLVERSGEIVTREEIQKKLWPNDTVVEFDHSINAAVNKLRQALGDSADAPKYVETVARRGYRLLVPVQNLGGDCDDASGSIPTLSPKTGEKMGHPRMEPVPGGLIGKKVSHYRVLSVIGGGGMGLVYEAEDLKLSRRVALKFLPEELASDAVALQRFEREAKTASSLNHPNICTIYEVEEYEGRSCIVMELLKGQTLRDWLTSVHAEQKAIPPEQILDVAIQVADGLQVAHEKGIVHRDIKPANIFLTTSGQVKILDFGVAKLLASDDRAHAYRRDDLGAIGVPRLAARTSGPLALDDALKAIEPTLTNTGLAMGTAGYMSPEQLRGEKVDIRTDIFSSGLVLYEMACGQRAFSGETAEIVRDAILNQTPVPVHERNSTIPRKLEGIINRAIEKGRRERYQSAAEMRADLQTLAADQSTRSESGKSRLRSRWKWPAAAAVVGVAIIAGGLYWRWHRPVKLTDKDRIVVGDFDNKTGDAIYDDTLKQGLSVQLEQSPFLNLVSEREVNKTLKEMGRQAGEHLTPEITREVCQRTGSKAILTGSIAPVGRQYIVGLKAVDCNMGDTLAEVQEQAVDKEAVLKALDKAAIALRKQIGESLGSVQKYATPLVEVTTPSLEALKAYSLGSRMRWAKGNEAALPFYQRALELDPNFAMAYAARSTVYGTTDERSAKDARRAFDLRERVNDRERFYIEAGYYLRATGELEKAAQVYELWQKIYPRDDTPYMNLGFVYAKLGNPEKALQESRNLIHLDPKTWGTYLNLAVGYQYLNRLDEAEAVYKEGQERNLVGENLLGDRYILAFLKDDTTQMSLLAAAAMAKPGIEDAMLEEEADTEAWYGRLRSARELTRRAMNSAQHSEHAGRAAASTYQAAAGLREVEFGNPKRARADADAALIPIPNRNVQAIATLTLARAGDIAAAEKLANELDKTFPLDTLMQRYWLPTIRAAVALQRKDPNRAVELLRATSGIEIGQPTDIAVFLCPVYLRGVAYLTLDDGNAAAVEFQKFIDYYGLVGNFPWGALARLGLARAYALDATTNPAALDKARTAYQNFLTLWKDADPDIPIYKQAKAEYATLQ